MRQNAWAVSALFVGLPLAVMAAVRGRYPKMTVLGYFRWRPWMVWVILTTIILFGVLRNFPAFYWLAPVAP